MKITHNFKFNYYGEILPGVVTIKPGIKLAVEPAYFTDPFDGQQYDAFGFLDELTKFEIIQNLKKHGINNDPLTIALSNSLTQR